MMIALRRHLDRACARFFRLAHDRRGVAAIEFAFIAPVLLILYFITMEVSQGIESNKKAARVASMVGDLVAQQPRMAKPEEIDAIMRIGEAIMQPYQRSIPHIVVTAIQLTDEPTPRAEVVWSRQLKDGVASRAALPKTFTTVPGQLMTRDTFLVRVTANLDYRPVIAWTADEKTTLGLTAAFDNIDMSESYYLRPRMTPVILCDEC